MSLRARSASEDVPRWRFGLVLLSICTVLPARADEPVRVLIIDGNGVRSAKKGGDAHYVRAVFEASKGYVPEVKDAAELERADLKKYPLVFLLNVPELSDAARTKLEEHVKAGGGAAFFLGDMVKPAHYNRRLYRKGEGIFPVSLAGRASETHDDGQKGKERAVYLCDPRHPLGADLVEMREFLKLLVVDRYIPVARAKGDGAKGRVQ